MLGLEEIKKALSSRKPILEERFQVKQIGVFGSVARSDQDETSDIDILVEFSGPVGWEFIDLLDYLQEVLGTKVDLVTPEALKPQLREKILSEVSYI